MSKVLGLGDNTTPDDEDKFTDKEDANGADKEEDKRTDKERDKDPESIPNGLISQILSISNEEDDEGDYEGDYKTTESRLIQVIAELSDISESSKGDEVAVSKLKLLRLQSILKTILISLIKDKLNSNFSKLNYESKLELLESERNLLIKEIQFISAKRQVDLIQTINNKRQSHNRRRQRETRPRRSRSKDDDQTESSSGTIEDETDATDTQSDSNNEYMVDAASNSSTTLTTVLASSTLGDGIPGKKTIQIITGAKLRGANHGASMTKDLGLGSGEGSKGNAGVFLKFDNQFKANYKYKDREKDRGKEEENIIHEIVSGDESISAPKTGESPQQQNHHHHDLGPVEEYKENRVSKRPKSDKFGKIISFDDGNKNYNKFTRNSLTVTQQPRQKRTYKHRNIFQYYETASSSSAPGAPTSASVASGAAEGHAGQDEVPLSNEPGSHNEHAAIDE